MTLALVGFAGLSALSFLQVGPLPEAAAAVSTRDAGSEVAGRRQLFLASMGGILGSLAAEDAEALTRRTSLPDIQNKNDPKRCVFKSSAMGQANAQRDKALDLRECKMAGTSAVKMDIAGVYMNDGDFSNVNFEETVMSKAIAQNANFEGANFRNAVVDRVAFDGANMKGAIFRNTILSGTNLENVNVENADFTDAFVDQIFFKPLCKNPTLKGKNPVTGVDTIESSGCDIELGRR